MSVINGRMPINSPIRELREKDAVKYFKDYIDFCEKDGMGIPSREPYDLAIAALEEIQQYRALGTVRQVEDFIVDWRKYREIGNLEELREAMERQRWIPCSERLPEENQLVWVSVKYQSGDIESVEGICKNGELCRMNGIGLELIAEAWMPRCVPEPYMQVEKANSDSEQRRESLF